LKSRNPFSDRPAEIRATSRHSSELTTSSRPNWAQVCPGESRECGTVVALMVLVALVVALLVTEEVSVVVYTPRQMKLRSSPPMV
jgi:hypothetical protein